MTDKGHPPPIGISRIVEQAYSHTGDNPYTGVGLGMAIIGSQAIQVCRTLSAVQYRYAVLYINCTAEKVFRGKADRMGFVGHALSGYFLERQ